MTNTILTRDEVSSCINAANEGFANGGVDASWAMIFTENLESKLLAALLQRAGVMPSVHRHGGTYESSPFNYCDSAQVTEAIAQLQARIEALSAEVELLKKSSDVAWPLVNKLGAERDQLRAQLEAQGEAVELIVNGRNVFDIDPSFVWSFLKLRSKFDAELMKAAWDALVLAAKATLSQHPAATHPAPAAPVVDESDIIARGRFHAFKGEDGEPDDWEWFEPGTNCEHGCVDAVIIRADALHPTQPKGEKA